MNDGGLRGGFDAHPRPATEFVGIREYIGIVRRHLWIVIAIVLASGAYTANKVMKAPAVFQSRATVRLVDTRTAMTGQMDPSAYNAQFSRFTDALESQIQVIQSRAVGAAAVDAKGLRLIPATGQPFVDEMTMIKVADDATADSIGIVFSPTQFTLSSALGQASAPYGQSAELQGVTIGVSKRPAIASSAFRVISHEAAIDHALGGFSASVRDKTDIIDLSYTGAEPHEVKRVVNAMAEGFQLQNASNAQQQSRRRRIFLEGQLRATDSSLARATSAYSSFRSGRQVFSSAGKAGAQEQGLVSIDMRRAELDAERSTYESLISQAERSGGSSSSLRALISSPGVASNPVVQQLATQLASLERTRDTLMSGGAAPTNPDLVSINAMIPQTSAQIIDAVRSQVQSIKARIASLDRLRATGASQIAAAPAGESEEEQLSQNVQTVQQMAAQLQQELQKAKMAEAVEAGQVEIVDLATSPGGQIPNGNSRKLALGLLVGLMLGVGAAIVLDNLNDSIRKRSDVERVLKVPGLAVIPKIAGTSLQSPSRMARALTSRAGSSRKPLARSNGELVTVHDKQSSGAEAFRTLRTNIMYSQAVRELHTLVVTSAAPGEGKSTTAANSAVTLAQQGLRVLLVDADLRRARLHRMFGVVREPGLTEYLLGQADIDDVARATEVTGLYVLPSGKLPPNPSELIGGEAMRRGLQALSEGYDIVVIDTPPLLAASDAAVLSTLVDGVIIVLRAGSTNVSAAQQSMEQLKAVGARVIGAVLNDPDTKVPEYGAYYRYEYDYAATAD
jgi:tyrosine-protein kinase Etk/Wzc